MARMTSKTISRRSQPLSAEQRQHMIGEAAYFRYVRRGFEPGHELDDWLAAEADFEHASASPPPESAAIAEFELQQSGTFGPAEDDVLKRSIKQHPRRDIPRIESVEPEEAPLKE